MDDMESQPQITPQDLEQLTPGDQRYLAEFMNNQATTAQLQNSVHSLTEVCFKKCIFGVSGGKLASKEESCVRNCVERYMDSQTSVLKHLETLRASQ
ncbi:Mitochondrial import inner membrane translocase subunit TIM8 [Cyphellophora attinorum]|uniref:Mitochondrial import inner membrane translocase subunit n=1 Tax=Cyphellophora attinorum TaxID=1664694 RepID=A0A0N1P1Z5_9EURO|nr:Mitochondrial import inner membrane translocase subunit TIM8 [Phialophora attinorum]KPI41512.1 Mitochondrial import inner membrane translocase subunit TIM8 [Phialophora attinorum]